MTIPPDDPARAHQRTKDTNRRLHTLAYASRRAQVEADELEHAFPDQVAATGNVGACLRALTRVHHHPTIAGQDAMVAGHRNAGGTLVLTDWAESDTGAAALPTLDLYSPTIANPQQEADAILTMLRHVAAASDRCPGVLPIRTYVQGRQQPYILHVNHVTGATRTSRKGTLLSGDLAAAPIEVSSRVRPRRSQR